MADDFSKTAVLIAAHGSPGSVGGRSATRRHAQSLAKLGNFAQVSAGFLTEKPFAANVLQSMRDTGVDDIYVVPNMASDGFIAREKLPQALDLTEQISEHIGPNGRQRVILTEVAATHPLIATFMADNVLSALQDLDIAQSDSALIVVGHGSSKGNANAEQTQKVADALPQYGLQLPIITAFLDQEPKVHDWRARTQAKTVIFALFLISDGFHATQDIPRAIGFDPEDAAFQAALAKDAPSQIRLSGSQVIFLSPVGESPKMADVFLARVKQAREALA